MTSLLHLVMQFKPIKSTPMQFHLLFSPPSNAFLHLPCSSACPALPQAGHPNTQHFYGGFFVQLSLPWHQQEHMLWARPLCSLESSQICPSSLHTTCSHVQPLPIPPRAHSGGVAAQVLLGQFLAGSRNHHSHSNLLLQSPSRIPHATPPGTPKHSSVTLGKTTSIWASPHWPIVPNPYLNSYSRTNCPSSTGESMQMLHHHELKGHHRCQGAKPTLSLGDTNDSEEQLKYEKWVRRKYKGQHRGL